MKTIGSKKEMKRIAEELLAANAGNEPALVAAIHEKVLKQKVRFPVLEFLAEALAAHIPENRQLAFSDAIVALDEIGSYVIAGKLLQLRLEKYREESLRKSCDYFALGDEWYVCDIIGERVFGWGLLHWPEELIPQLKKFAVHPDKWVVRSVGVAIHFAVKKGLDFRYVPGLFRLLLSLSQAKEFHTKRGIGWAAKTIAKHYPELIHDLSDEIEEAQPGAWFRTKIRIGLGRAPMFVGRFDKKAKN